MMHKKIASLAIILCFAQNICSQDKQLFFISNSHLDTQWNWNVKTTLNEYIPNTMKQNISLLEKYSTFNFNFEAAIHYQWMKEYYPADYARVKEYIEQGRWHISGGSINANDVMVPSAESIIRNFLYGQTYYKKEFGRKGGSDIMLPDCFGFPYSLPTLGKHCGVTGFHTAKLAWGSAYDYNSLAPFGIWQGVDGSEIYAIFKGEPYDSHEIYNKDMSKDADMERLINDHQAKYGIPAAFRYVGPRSDRGGGLKDNPNENGENTPYWLQQSVNSDGPVNVRMSTPDEIFAYLDRNRNDKYFVWNNELPLSVHGTGCYTSQAILKYWNRKNELLADATEKISVQADWLGGLEYPSDAMRESWTRILWHQFHDDLTGTAIPNAYNFSYNDEVLANLELSNTLRSSVGAVARLMDTQVDGIPLIVYNPLSIPRTDIVEVELITTSRPDGIRVLNGDGQDMPVQITDFDVQTGKLSFIFQATVPSLGQSVYQVKLNEKVSASSSLTVTKNSLENENYTLTLNQKGDVVSIYDKKHNIELLVEPIRLALLNDRSTSFPSWEIQWDDVKATPAAYVDENVEISIAEEGPLRVSLKIKREKDGSEFVQYIRMTLPEISERIDFVNEVNWQSRGKMLKAVFPVRSANEKATYDISIGAIERGVNTSRLYEVPGHQWADQTSNDETYGISILNDCKYGWDKPNNATLRLTLIHTPAVGKDYSYQKDQDLGLNKFTYSFYKHAGKWNESTQWEASRLNQPLLAFRAPRHQGVLGKEYSFLNLSTDKVAVKALKKAEESDEIIIRVYELTGNDQPEVKVTFPAEIVSAREVNGIEEEVGTASYRRKELLFRINRFQPKTFAVKMVSAPENSTIEKPSSVKIDLDYNIDVMSSDSRMQDATSGVTYAYPAELLSEVLTEDVLTADGIEFKIGNRANGARNAMFCNGQEITLPKADNTRKLYILAASKQEAGSTAEFMVDGEKHSLFIPYYAGNVGVWETEFNLGREYRRENTAFTATHRHNVADRRNDFYNFMYIYKFAIPVDENASRLTLPSDRDIYVLAVSLSDNENDDVTPASAITSLPEYTDLSPVAGDCNIKLTPISAKASHQNGNNEGPEKAIDGDLNTKWCVTNNSTPYLELTFAEEVEICRWFVMNAGTEGSNSITSAFRLQRYENGQWIDVDVITDNTVNKFSKNVEPFKTTRVRLQINKGEQNGNTTRILEFAVYGQGGGVSIDNPQTEENNLHITGVYPNPVTTNAVIHCVVPAGVQNLNVQIYDLLGRSVYTNSVEVSSEETAQEINWEISSVENGVYLCTVSALHKGKNINSKAFKVIVNK